MCTSATVRIWVGVLTRVFYWGRIEANQSSLLDRSKMEVKDLASSVFNSARTAIAFLQMGSFIEVPRMILN